MKNRDLNKEHKEVNTNNHGNTSWYIIRIIHRNGWAYNEVKTHLLRFPTDLFPWIFPMDDGGFGFQLS